jgi:hypothetical protein
LHTSKIAQKDDAIPALQRAGVRPMPPDFNVYVAFISHLDNFLIGDMLPPL